MLYRFSAVITDGSTAMTNYSCLSVDTNVFSYYCYVLAC